MATKDVQMPPIPKTPTTKSAPSGGATQQGRSNATGKQFRGAQK